MTRNYYFYFMLPLLLWWPLALLKGQSRAIDMGEIVRLSNKKVKNISLISSDREILNLVVRGFSLHGAYAIKSQGNSVFTFRFTPKGPQSIQVSIESGNPLKAQFTQLVTGANRREATLLAADLVVLKTLGIPGFFAGNIAFVGNRSGHREIYVSDLFFGQVRQITHDRTHSVLPHWSPDGRKIYYTSYYRNGFPDIYAIDLNTLERSTFASFKGINTGATFNPRGSEVAMVLSGTGNSEIYISNTLGRNLRRLTRNPAVEADPTWSPDGERIAFTSNRLGKPQLFEMSRRGGNPRRIPTNNSGNCTEPTWNPRHANILVFTAAVGKEFEIALYDFEKQGSRWLTSGRGDAVEPCWTKDGRHLIYTARTSKYQRLMIIDTETGKAQPLSPEDFGNASQPAYVSAVD